MNVLILGGTGAMGRYVTELLAQKGVHITVTSRRTQSSENELIKYLEGNAMNDAFLQSVTRESEWDAIVDFMNYHTSQFEKRVKLLLDSTKQYVFISSARVYADSEEPIDENSPRLLDTCMDEVYLQTDEYALSKARQENMLFQSGYKNWTIIRPSLTYGEKRFQLGAYEKENWLYRALHGRKIVFSEDLINRYYTLSWGNDVASCIAQLIGNEKAFGEIFNPVLSRAIKWSDVLDIYTDVIQQETGRTPEILLTKTSTNLKIPGSKYQVIYGRYFNRKFDNSKLKNVVNTSEWAEAETGLRQCLTEFLKNPEFLAIDYMKEAYIDQAAHEFTPLSEIEGRYNKFKYICFRFHLSFLWKLCNKIKKVF